MMNSPVKFTWRTITDESWSFFFLIKAVFLKKEASIQTAANLSLLYFNMTHVHEHCLQSKSTLARHSNTYVLLFLINVKC